MRALAIVHQRDAGAGVFADEMRDRGVELDEWLLTKRGTGPPREIADYDAVLTFGGAMHADQEDRHPWLRFEKDFLDNPQRIPEVVRHYCKEFISSKHRSRCAQDLPLEVDLERIPAKILGRCEIAVRPRMGLEPHFLLPRRERSPGL